ncbi:MAG: hypothetical protein JWO94_2160, partial [Verrucomicrobiaceae bacterium]|nr:hypothetical protein [Verrucomicrobiaceae bacterium]
EIDEAGSTATSLLLQPSQERSTQATVPASLVADVIAIRPHLRLADLFPTTTYHATGSSSTADQILLWDSTTNGYLTFWLASFLGQHWHQLGVASLTATEDSRVISPAEGVFVRPRAIPANAFASGQLRTWKFAMSVRLGTNFISNPFPLAQSPVDRTMTVAGGFTGKTSASSSDRIYFWAGDTDAAATGYTTYQLFKAGQTEIWKDVGSTDLSTNMGLQKLFLNSRAGFINSIKGKADWMIPAPAVP